MPEGIGTNLIQRTVSMELAINLVNIPCTVGIRQTEEDEQNPPGALLTQEMVTEAEEVGYLQLHCSRPKALPAPPSVGV